jgi:hypothetical protein
MKTTSPMTFPGITPEQYSALLAKAKAAGIALSGTSGTASRLGVEISWNYSPDSRVLDIECLRTPFFLKPEEVNARIEALVRETIAVNRLV